MYLHTFSIVAATNLTSPSYTEVGEEPFSLAWASGSVPVVAPPTCIVYCSCHMDWMPI
jgi:hypothetical protein